MSNRLFDSVISQALAEKLAQEQKQIEEEHWDNNDLCKMPDSKVLELTRKENARLPQNLVAKNKRRAKNKAAAKQRKRTK